MNKHPLVVAVLTAVPTREARFSEMHAYDNGIRYAAEILENALDNKSFGWVIRRSYSDLGKKGYQYLSQVLFADEQHPTRFNWANSQHNSTLLPVEFKDAVLQKLAEATPGTEYEAVELFMGSTK